MNQSHRADLGASQGKLANDTITKLLDVLLSMPMLDDLTWAISSSNDSDDSLQVTGYISMEKPLQILPPMHDQQGSIHEQTL